MKYRSKSKRCFLTILCNLAKLLITVIEIFEIDPAELQSSRTDHIFPSVERVESLLSPISRSEQIFDLDRIMSFTSEYTDRQDRGPRDADRVRRQGTIPSNTDVGRDIHHGLYCLS